MIKRLLIITLILIYARLNNTYAQQSSCIDKLDQAKTAFEKGQLYGIPALLENCLDKGFTKEDNIEAYRLLTITYLFIDNPIGAENSFLGLLKFDSEYRIKPNDPIELLHLSKQFISTPIVSFRGRLGINYSNISVLKKNGTNNININSSQYKLAPGFSVVGSFDLHFNKMISISAEADVSNNSFKFFDGHFDSDGVQNAKNRSELKEKSWNVGIPITIKLTYPGKKYYPYVYGGYSPNYNIYTRVDVVETYKEGLSEITSKENDVNITQIREPYAHSIVVGLGLMRRIEYNYIFIDVRYKIGLRNRVIKENQYAVHNKDINSYVLTNYQVDNLFKQNEFSITVGYVLPKYKPRKKGVSTVNSFVTGLFKKHKKNE